MDIEHREDNGIVDPESNTLVRFTDNGLKEGDLEGINPNGGYLNEMLDKVRNGVVSDA